MTGYSEDVVVVEQVTVGEPVVRMSLSEMAALGAEELIEELERAFPVGRGVAVAAFNSSV